MPAKNKRAAAVVAKEDAKKPRVDPKLVPVTSAISKVENMPAKCKDMLIAMLAPSLKFGPSSERHEIQTAALGMIEETLQQEKARMQELVSASEQKLGNLNSTKEEKAAEQAAAEAVLFACKETEQTQKTLLAEASTAQRSAQQSLTEAIEAQKQGDTTFEANKKEKELLDTAFSEHYKTPMDADQGPHFASLQPLLSKLTLDESLLSALPSSCVKLKDQRGSFDIVVLSELEKAFTTKIAELGSLLDAEEPAAADRKAKVEAAQSDYDQKKEAQKEAVTAFDAAQKAVKEGEQESAKAMKVTADAELQVTAEAQVCEVLKEKLSEFEAGPMGTFTALKEPPSAPALETVEAAEEVATAGA